MSHALRSQRVRSRTGATAVALALMLSGAVASTSAMAEDGASASSVPEEGLIAEYVFAGDPVSEVPNTALEAELGTAVVHNATDGQWGATSLALTDTSKESGTWVQLPDDILTGATSATVSIEVKPTAEVLGRFHFLWSIGQGDPNQPYVFAALNCNNGRAPLVGIKANGHETLVPASDCAASADQWLQVTAVIDGEAGEASLYLNGTRISHGAVPHTPADVEVQNLNAIGRSPWPDDLFTGEVATFRVYDRALTAEEVVSLSDADAAIHADEHQARAEALLAGIPAEYTTSDDIVLPTAGGAITWTTSDADVITATGRVQPDAEPRHATLTATVEVRGVVVTKDVPVTVNPSSYLPDDDYGYLMVHFVEDSQGYAEKIYLSLSRGNSPYHWDRLNGGEPILASNLGTTGIRDPYLTYNPDTGVYYIIATDLRVFGGLDCPTNDCWGAWQQHGSLNLNIWESVDLVTWTDYRQIEVSPPSHGMSWAPEATWEPSANNGEGAFIVYWSSTIYEDDDVDRVGPTYSRVVWGETTDFTQDTYSYGGVMIDEGASVIDTTILQHDGATYRFSKDNGSDRQLYVEATDTEQWWLPGTEWETLQTQIGLAEFGAVEGPAAFRVHGEDRWILLLDDYPTPGYQPFSSEDPSQPNAWGPLDGEGVDFHLPALTKHGGVIGLTKAQHDQIRAADIAEIPEPELGSVEVDDVSEIDLPTTVRVLLHDGRHISVPIVWEEEPTTVDESETETSLTFTGTVSALGNNLNQSTSNDPEIAELISTTALPPLQFEVVIASTDDGTDPDDPGNGDDDGDNGDSGTDPGTDDDDATGSDDDTSSDDATDGELVTTGASLMPFAVAILLLAGGLALRATTRRHTT